MMRLILLLFVIAAMLVAAAVFLAAFRAATTVTTQIKEDPMPDTFKRVAYVLLVLLLIGISTGWLGAA